MPTAPQLGPRPHTPLPLNAFTHSNKNRRVGSQNVQGRPFNSYKGQPQNHVKRQNRFLSKWFRKTSSWSIFILYNISTNVFRKIRLKNFEKNPKYISDSNFVKMFRGVFMNKGKDLFATLHYTDTHLNIRKRTSKNVPKRRSSERFKVLRSGVVERIIQIAHFPIENSQNKSNKE